MTNGTAETPTTHAQTNLWREVFGWRFWLNYTLGILLTLWFPLAKIQMQVNGEAHGEAQYIPMYRIYKDIALHPTLWTAWKYAIAHLGIVFLMMALVWYSVYRWTGKPRTT